MAALEDYRKGGEVGLERILSFSDGIFAFSITLLVLDLVVPVIPAGPDQETQLVKALAGEFTGYLAYFTAFFIIGIYWIGHHRMFRYVRRYDSRLLWLNLIFLLFITIEPFSTKLLDAYNGLPITSEIYGLDQALAGLVQFVVWRYASRGHRLIAENLKPEVIHIQTLRTAVAPLVFFPSILVATVDPFVADLMWLALFPTFFILGRLTRRAEKEQ